MTEDPADPAAQNLLGPGDPPPVAWLGPPIGSSTPTRPILLLCDHASRAIPLKLADLGLDEGSLRRHIGWDIGAVDVTRLLAATIDAPAIVAGHSRLVIDCNRELDDPTAMPEISDGIAIPGNRGLGPAEKAARIRACFDPYHGAIAAAIEKLSRDEVVPALVSIHSFTPVMNGFVRPWHIGILWDRDPRIALPLMAALSELPDVTVGDNEPYSAREPCGGTLFRHAEITGLPHVMIELRQDLIDTADGAQLWADRLSRALRPILADPTLYRRWPDPKPAVLR